MVSWSFDLTLRVLGGGAHRDRSNRHRSDRGPAGAAPGLVGKKKLERAGRLYDPPLRRSPCLRNTAYSLMLRPDRRTSQHPAMRVLEEVGTDLTPGAETSSAAVAARLRSAFFNAITCIPTTSGPVAYPGWHVFRPMAAVSPLGRADGPSRQATSPMTSHSHRFHRRD